MATINTIEDLIQLLDDNPHWVEALRVRLLTRELIELPEKFARFVEATNQRFDRIEGRLDRVEERLGGVEGRLDRVEGRLDRLTDDVGILKGAHARSTALRQADMIAEDMGLTLVRVLSRDDLRALTPSQGVADIPASHLRSFRLADLVIEAANENGETSFVAVEISFTVNGRDTARAVRNTDFLSRFTGRPARAAVAGARLDERIRGPPRIGRCVLVRAESGESRRRIVVSVQIQTFPENSELQTEEAILLDHRVLQSLLDAHREAVGQPVRAFDIGGRPFDFNRFRYLVGVINLSIDSWYRESVCGTTEEAIARAEQLYQDGADIIDVGAESTLRRRDRPTSRSNSTACCRWWRR